MIITFTPDLLPDILRFQYSSSFTCHFIPWHHTGVIYPFLRCPVLLHITNTKNETTDTILHRGQDKTCRICR